MSWLVARLGRSSVGLIGIFSPSSMSCSQSWQRWGSEALKHIHLCSQPHFQMMPPNHQRIGKDRSALVMFAGKWGVIARSVRSIRG